MKLCIGGRLCRIRMNHNFKMYFLGIKGILEEVINNFLFPKGNLLKEILALNMKKTQVKTTAIIVLTLKVI